MTPLLWQGPAGKKVFAYGFLKKAVDPKRLGSRSSFRYWAFDLEKPYIKGSGHHGPSIFLPNPSFLQQRRARGARGPQSLPPAKRKTSPFGDGTPRGRSVGRSVRLRQVWSTCRGGFATHSQGIRDPMELRPETRLAMFVKGWGSASGGPGGWTS